MPTFGGDSAALGPPGKAREPDWCGSRWQGKRLVRTVILTSMLKTLEKLVSEGCVLQIGCLMLVLVIRNVCSLETPELLRDE